MALIFTAALSTIVQPMFLSLYFIKFIVEFDSKSTISKS